MPLYLSKFSYTPETWARLIGNPEDRRKAAQSYIESVGGKLHGFWYAFGGHDGYNLWEAPDNVSMAAVALAISGGGALSSFETTVLLTVDETRRCVDENGCSIDLGCESIGSANICRNDRLAMTTAVLANVRNCSVEVVDDGNAQLQVEKFLAEVFG